MFRLFDGYRGAHGTHGVTKKNSSKGGKLEIKKSARTIREPLTEDLWREHLSGSRALGVIPINENFESRWGCIDIDEYDLDLAEVAKKIEKLPLVLCRTKSGGAHLYLFLKEWVSAAEIRVVLRELSASLGWGTSEVFPKQDEFLAERGDLGNWLNMPYLGGDDTERYGVKLNGLSMTLSEFLDYAEESQVALETVPVPTLLEETNSPKKKGDLMDSGPPCLQHLTRGGFPEGTRNRGLFAMGVFAQKKWPSDWETRVEEINQKYMQPPLPAQEVTQILTSLRGKEYQYTCKDEPLLSHCNAALCRTRRFGVGRKNSFPVIGTLTKLDTDDPIWFLDLDGEGRVEVTTRELQQFRLFQAACMDQLTVMYAPIKEVVWIELVAEAMENATVIQPSPEMTTSGWFSEILDQFLNSRHRGSTRDDIRLGKPYLDMESGRFYFRLRDLMDHLDREGFRDWGRNKVGSHITELGGGKKGLNLSSGFVNTFYIDEKLVSSTPHAPTPKLKKDPI